MQYFSRVRLQKTIAMVLVLFAFGAGSRSFAQMAEDNGSEDNGSYDAIPQPTSVMSENELANLVAPIALYPDGLLGQVLVACTYPDEVVQAQWFLEQNGNLPGLQLMAAARQQNWDPSVQLLVAFPDVVALLNHDLRWTTEVGNAFLAQQADVMNAIQDLRAQAQGNGQLESTPQLSVNTDVQGDRSAIEIQPADPQRMFVPSYDPNAVWGPPAQGDYPSLPYEQGVDFASVVGTVANLAGLLPGVGLLGPRSWGWALSWLGQALFVNNGFFSDFGFHGYDGGGRGSSLWVHDGNRGFGGRYGNNQVAGWHDRGGVGGEGWRTFGSRSRIGPRPESRQALDRSRGWGSQGFSGQNRGERSGDWKQFNAGGRTDREKHFGRQSSLTARNATLRQQGNYRSSYFARTAENRSGSFRSGSFQGRSFQGARSFDSGSRSSSFSNSGRMRGEEGSRRTKEPHFSAAHLSSHGESSFRKSSHRDSSWKHGSSSHSFKQPKAPKYKAPHYAKSHGGGLSSGGGHSGKKSHHG